MEQLVRETGKTAVMSVLEGMTGLCIHHVEPKGTAVKYVAHRGMGVPVHVGATGKVLLAFCRENLRERIFAAGLPDGVDRDALRRQLVEIRRRGYAYSREEWMEHAGDISVPLVDGRGEFVAQLGLAGLVTSFDGQEEALVAKLKDVAIRVSRVLHPVFSE
jgi:DNA-binding IclR family transcriptional regulator